MKRYEEYQNVAQKWVKDIPAHWDFFRIKRIFAQRVEKNDPVITDNILSLTAKQGVVPYGEKEGTGGNMWTVPWITDNRKKRPPVVE